MSALNCPWCEETEERLEKLRADYRLRHEDYLIVLRERNEAVELIRKLAKRWHGHLFIREAEAFLKKIEEAK